jgi:hypothetical protein
MKLLSPIFALLALLSAVLCLCALVGLNPTLPGTWSVFALLEQEVAGRVLPELKALEGFYRALLYMGLAAAFAGLCAYLKPRVVQTRVLIPVRETRPREFGRR